LELEQVARAEAEAANRIKDEFLAVLSHELRSPLNPILGWAKLLQSREFDKVAVKKALSTIEHNAQLQAPLIEDLLDVSRILQGKLSLNMAAVNLSSTIQAALKTVRLAAEAKNIYIHTKLDTACGQVLGDLARLQQVVWNLLSNAVKFTPEGGRVDIRLEHIGSHAQITVSDTGKGIHPNFLPYVFETFRQADSTTTRKFGGLGLFPKLAKITSSPVRALMMSFSTEPKRMHASCYHHLLRLFSYFVTNIYISIHID
jgi:signal transduction histidine kinase